MSSLHVVILAAGAGTRMCSATPKVLHPLLGKPMLEHVITTSKALNPYAIWLIYGHQGDALKTAITDTSLHWILQSPRLGTGHAMQILYPNLVDAKPDDKILILSADSPAITPQTLTRMLDIDADMALLNIVLENPTGFGRIIRDTENNVKAIIEHKDADEVQRTIQEIYSGIMWVKFKHLTHYLPKLTAHNAQKEYYITDLVKLLVTDHLSVKGVIAKDAFEALGVNDRAQLAELERYMQKRQAHVFMLQGVSIVDPNRFDLRGELHAKSDVRIDINCIIEGKVSIGEGSHIGAHCILKNCQIGNHVTILPYTHIDGAIIDDNAVIGPFARLRPETHIEMEAHVGNFVEIKKSTLGKKSKANHLSYLGDATIGENVNIGAGTITCNYDGINKHQTTIYDNAFIGSNTSLIAPVTIGKNATIGAGSTISHSTPENELTLSRAKQTTIPGWKRPKKRTPNE